MEPRLAQNIAKSDRDDAAPSPVGRRLGANTSPNVYPLNHNLFRFHTCRLPHSTCQHFFLRRRTSLPCATRPLLSLVPSHLPDFNVPIEVLHAGICPRPPPHGTASATHRAQDVSSTAFVFRPPTGTWGSLDLPGLPAQVGLISWWV